MKQDKLISMVAFVKQEQDNFNNFGDSITFRKRVINYANFLSQPLTLGMFVPCLNGVALKEPKDASKFMKGIEYDLINVKKEYAKQLEQYQQAKERVLFDLPNLETDMDVLKNLIMGNTIELLVDESTTLTETALKQIGLNN